MKKSPQFVGLSIVFVMLTVTLQCSKSSNANDSASGASNKFLGMWKVAPDSETDFKGGPITFKDDNTYSAQRTTDPSSATVSGSYTLKGGKLYLGGELEKFGEDGMSIEPDGRMKLTRNGKTIYFVKS